MARRAQALEERPVQPGSRRSLRVEENNEVRRAVAPSHSHFARPFYRSARSFLCHRSSTAYRILLESVALALRRRCGRTLGPPRLQAALPAARLRVARPAGPATPHPSTRSRRGCARHAPAS
jgi:hypothetical protein